MYSSYLGLCYLQESLAEFVFAIVKREPYSPFLDMSLFVFGSFNTVTMITGLILLGLIIDLGGGPDHDRRGFRVRVLWILAIGHT